MTIWSKMPFHNYLIAVEYLLKMQFDLEIDGLGKIYIYQAQKSGYTPEQLAVEIAEKHNLDLIKASGLHESDTD